MKRSRLAGCCSALALAASAAGAQGGPAASEPVITVYGDRIQQGIRADSELDENGIAAFGADTVADLLDALALETDSNGDGPVVLINGQLANGLDDIADLPSEVVSRIQLLSRGSAALIGQRPGRRVINVVVKPDHKQATLFAKRRQATRGDGGQSEGEANLIKLDNGNRRSLVLRAVKDDMLLESDRRIDSTGEGIPFDPAGNIVATVPGGEIDPALSLIAGFPALVAGVPSGVSSPTLGDFAALAGEPNRGGLGSFRTLLPEAVTLTANANVSQKFGRHGLSLSARANREERDSRLGGSLATLVVPATSPFSPFSKDVTLASVLGSPLEQELVLTTLTTAAVLNGPLGKWRYTFNVNGNWRWSETKSERALNPDALQAAIAGGSVSPFAPFPTGLLGEPRRERSSADGFYGVAQATASGPLFTLPAGMARLASRLEWRTTRSTSESDAVPAAITRRVRRNDLTAAATVQLPLIANPSFGSLGAEVSGALRHVTDSGSVHDYGAALNWDPTGRFSARVSIDHEQLAPPPSAIGDAVVTLDGVRVFDFVREETVFVSYITGGNPDLDPERRRKFAVGASWRPFDRPDLSLSVDYTDVRSRGAFAALPPANADVQLAYPDRFQRDLSGRLISVDARPVAFALVRRQELRLGLTVNHVFPGSGGRAGAPGGGASGGDPAEGFGTGLRLSGYLNHFWTLRSDRQARAGLPVVDLLEGGAIGYGGGQPRHRLQAGAGAVRNGLGANFEANYVGPSSITVGSLESPDRLRFDGRLLVDGRLFANLGPLLPERRWAKGMRIALGVENVFDDKARVRDESGVTPLGYQPYLIDALGRTISLSVRKVL